MSRLDDELRNAFRREQPSSDFAARVLERVAKQPAPRQSWWHRLASLLEPPKLRWVAIGVTASLLLAIGAAQYSNMKRVVIQEDGKVAEVEKPSGESSKSDVAPGERVQPDVKTTPQITRNKGAAAISKRHRQTLAQIQKERELRKEAEAAAEKLMLALSIASTALNDAQKAVHDDGLKP